MMGDRRWRRIRIGAPLWEEMSERVNAAYQSRRVRHSRGLAHIGWKIADRKSDATLTGWVGFGPMHEAHVVQGHLTRLQNQGLCITFVHLDRNLLAAAQEVVVTERVVVRELFLLWVPGMTRIAPFASTLSEIATQAVTISAGSKPQ